MNPVSDEAYTRSWETIAGFVSTGELTMRQAMAVSCTVRQLVRKGRIVDDYQLRCFDMAFWHFMKFGTPITFNLFQ